MKLAPNSAPERVGGGGSLNSAVYWTGKAGEATASAAQKTEIVTRVNFMLKEFLDEDRF